MALAIGTVCGLPRKRLTAGVAPAGQAEPRDDEPPGLGRRCMPTYVFRCGGCGEQFEKVMTISEREKGKAPSCPKCKKHKVERVYTSFYAKTGRKS